MHPREPVPRSWVPAPKITRSCVAHFHRLWVPPRGMVTGFLLVGPSSGRATAVGQGAEHCGSASVDARSGHATSTCPARLDPWSPLCVARQRHEPKHPTGDLLGSGARVKAGGKGTGAQLRRTEGDGGSKVSTEHSLRRKKHHPRVVQLQMPHQVMVRSAKNLRSSSLGSTPRAWWSGWRSWRDGCPRRRFPLCSARPGGSDRS